LASKTRRIGLRLAFHLSRRLVRGLPEDPRSKIKRKKHLKGFDKSDGFDREVYQL